MFNSLHEDVDFLRMVFTSWSEPLEQSLELAKSDLELWCLIANYVEANVKQWGNGSYRIEVVRRYSCPEPDCIYPYHPASLELEFSANTVSLSNPKHQGKPYNHVWLRNRIITWRRDRYIDRDNTLTGHDEVKRFIRSLFTVPR